MPKKILLSLLCLILALSLCACNQTPAQDEATPPADSGQSEPATDGGESPDANPAATREFTDMAGRTLDLPAVVNTGLGTGAIGTYMLYTMDPETMVGVNYSFNDDEKNYILPAYHDLPDFGQGQGLNLEAVVTAAPDVLIVYGDISETTIADTESIQQQTGIPCVMLGGDMAQIPAAYRMLGEVFAAHSQQCEALAVYAEKALAFAAALDIPEEERVSVYYGNGLENLETAPQGSWHAELLDVVQAKNVAVMEGEITNRIEVSPEQIIAWNPQVIILNGEPTESLSPGEAVAGFLADERYHNVQAVQDGQVYAIPKYPYSWFDRPPGPNRLIGIYWLTETLYPDLADIDIKAEAQDFYSLFYHIELTDVQLTDLLLGY